MVLVKELCVIRHFFIGLHAQMVYGCAAIFSDIGRSISIIADIGSIQEIRYRSSFLRRRRLGRHNLPPRHAGHLAFLKKHRRTPEHIVIIDDISRLARALRRVFSSSPKPAMETAGWKALPSSLARILTAA
jgi:hypothetical protein